MVDPRWANEDQIAEPTERGPLLWEHVRSAQAGDPCIESIEGALYTDVDVNGSLEVGDGVLRVVSTQALGPSRRLAAVAQLNIHDAAILDGKVRIRTESTSYHGGDDLDEIAALLSLGLGARFRSGGMTRTTGLGHRDGPGGRPTEWTHRPPLLPEPGRLGAVLPSLTDTVEIGDSVRVFSSALAADRATAVKVVRSARLYQQAIWIADGDPNQAWLQLVSALETAAACWTSMKGSKRKFVAFFKEFLPAADDSGASDEGLVDWSNPEALLRTVYRYRSQALHDGEPFPWPMLEPPRNQNAEAIAQRPTGLASSGHGGTWAVEDTPVYLDAFAQKTRDVLLGWISSLPGAAP